MSIPAIPRFVSVEYTFLLGFRGAGKYYLNSIVESSIDEAVSAHEPVRRREYESLSGIFPRAEWSMDARPRQRLPVSVGHPACEYVGIQAPLVRS